MANETRLPYEPSNLQKNLFVVLRIFIGWHLLYEGVAKMLIPQWTSAQYLENSQWIFSGMFHWIAANEVALSVVDFLNIWGLTILGLFLLVGFMTRYAAVLSIVMVGLYYVANPPFIGTDFGIQTEGHYLIVNKNLIEMIALALLAVFPTGYYIGLDGLLKKRNSPAIAPTSNPVDEIPEKKSNFTFPVMNRRESLKYLSVIPVVGTFIYAAFRKHNWEKVNAISGATIKVSDRLAQRSEGRITTWQDQRSECQQNDPGRKYDWWLGAFQGSALCAFAIQSIQYGKKSV